MERNVQDKAGPGPDPGKSGPVIGRGMIAGIVIIIVIAVFFGTFIMADGGVSASVPPQACGQQVIAYVNANLVQQGTVAELGSVRETNGVYEITTRYQGSEIPLYATKDCTLLFSSSYRIVSPAACDTQAGSCSPSAPPATPAPADPVKSARPSAELYVMSFCPYGVQAQNAMKPVVDLLKDSIDIRVIYIATVRGDSIATVQSLHGNAEAVEDARQLCIAKYARDRYWEYLMAFNAQCYPAWSNPAQLALCRKNVTASLGIPSETIDRCAAGSEGMELLRADEARAGATRSTASPTLLINGQKYAGARTAEAFKQAICSRFETAPPECNTVLASQSATASGSC